MKITITVLMVVVLALTVGVAYAESGTTATKAGIYNGITYFDVRPDHDCASVRGADEANPATEAVLMNGVTYFERAAPGSRPLCAAATSDKKPGVLMNNGITIFSMR